MSAAMGHGGCFPPLPLNAAAFRRGCGFSTIASVAPAVQCQ